MKCSCGQDLTTRNSVRRTYTNKDDGPDKHGYGHYEENGDFETDNTVHLGDGRYDLVDGSDTCATCGEVIG